MFLGHFGVGFGAKAAACTVVCARAAAVPERLWITLAWSRRLLNNAYLDIRLR